MTRTQPWTAKISGCNVDGFDRGVRIALGALLLGWAAFGDSDARAWGLAGFWPLLTGLTRLCPMYLPFRVSSCRWRHFGGAERHSPPEP